MSECARLHTKGLKNLITHYDEHVEIYPNSWALFCDKSCIDSLDFLRALYPHRKPANGRLTVTEEERNDCIGTDCVIVEFFGRLRPIWSLFSDKYRWDHGV